MINDADFFQADSTSLSWHSFYSFEQALMQLPSSEGVDWCHQADNRDIRRAIRGFQVLISAQRKTCAGTEPQTDLGAD